MFLKKIIQFEAIENSKNEDHELKFNKWKLFAGAKKWCLPPVQLQMTMGLKGPFFFLFMLPKQLDLALKVLQLIVLRLNASNIKLLYNLYNF